MPPSCWFLAWLIIQAWRFRRHVLPKRQLTFTKVHGVISSYFYLWFHPLSVQRDKSCNNARVQLIISSVFTLSNINNATLLPAKLHKVRLELCHVNTFKWTRALHRGGTKLHAHNMSLYRLRYLSSECTGKCSKHFHPFISIRELPRSNTDQDPSCPGLFMSWFSCFWPYEC
jgi:hypothetical protein